MTKLNQKVPMKTALSVLFSAAAVCAALIVFFLTHPAPAPVKAEAAPVTPAPEPPAPQSEVFDFEAFHAETAQVYVLDEECYPDSDDPFRSFWLALDMESGMFQYYETPVSSYFGIGVFTLDGGILTMDDSYRVNRFRMEADGDKLVWIEEGSDNFWFEKLTDGASFSLEHTPVAAAARPTASS